jgi:Phosphotyrosyl phosphate activator (PTPA) protein
VHTGSPVRLLIDVEPRVPDVLPNGTPDSWEPAGKRIRTQQDVQSALWGSTLRSFVAFTVALSDAVVGVPNSRECQVSEGCTAVMAALDRLSDFCAETPPVTHAVRYGNPAYRTWFDKMQGAAPELVYNMLGDELGPATVELVPYFLDSFGNRSRIDFGTGHETTFLMLLYCLFALGVLREEDRQAVVTHVFWRYIKLMRQLQTTFWCAHACTSKCITTQSNLPCACARRTTDVRCSPLACPVPTHSANSFQRTSATRHLRSTSALRPHQARAQARARGLARRVGPRRVPLLPLRLWRRAAAGPPLHEADQRHRRRRARRVRRRLHVPRRGALRAARQEGAAARDVADAVRHLGRRELGQGACCNEQQHDDPCSVVVDCVVQRAWH